MKAKKIINSYFSYKQKKYIDEEKIKKIDFGGFATYIANSSKKLGIDWIENQIDLKNLANYISESNITDNIHSEVDSYFTPNTFISKNFNKNSHRNWNYVAFINALWLDIDKTGIDNPREAKDKLYKAIEKIGLPEPHLTVKTSQNEDDGVRLQVHWLIDPLWVYDNRPNFNDFLSKDRMKWWQDVQSALIQLLDNELEDWEFDRKPTQYNAYARMPNSVHQETNELVEVLDFQEKQRFDLQTDCFDNLKREAKKLELEKRNYNSYKVVQGFKKDDINLLKLKQSQIILQNGVAEGYRNTAQVSVSLLCKYSGLSYMEAKEILLEFNKKCDPPEKESQILKVLKSIYKSNYGIKTEIIANLCEVITGKKQAKDIRYALASHKNCEAGTYQCQDIYDKKAVIVRKAISTILELYSYDKGFTKKQIAKEANLSYDTLKRKKYWSLIAKIIKEQFGIRLRYNRSLHRYVYVQSTSNSNNNIELFEAVLKLDNIKYRKKQINQLTNKFTALYFKEERVKKVANFPT